MPVYSLQEGCDTTRQTGIEPSLLAAFSAPIGATFKRAASSAVIFASI